MKKILDIVKSYKNSSMLRNVTKIVSGTMVGQLISFITLPIYTRIYGAEILGYWSLFTSVAMVVNTFSDLGMTNAIMMERDEEESRKLFSVIMTFTLFFSFITGVTLFLYYTFNDNSTGIHPLFYAVVLSVLIFTQQQTQLCYSWLNKKGQYSVLMNNPIINNISIALVAISLGVLGFVKYGYYIGVIIGQFLTILHMRRHIPKIYFNLKIREIKSTVNKNIDYVKFQMPTYMFAQIKTQMPTFFINMFYGTKMLGYYSVSVRILNIPITLLANAIGKVYYQTIVDMNNKGEKIGEFTYKNLLRAIKIAIIPIIIILSVGDIVCVVFLGKDYLVAGNIVRIVASMYFFTFLMMATQGITIVLKKQYYTLISAIVQIIAYSVGLFAGKILFDSIYISCFFMTVAFCIVQIIYFCQLFKVMDVNPLKYLKCIICAVIITTIFTVIIRGVLDIFNLISFFV